MHNTFSRLRNCPATGSKQNMDTVKHQIYTCISCQVAFANPEHQRAHYKTDWHRYNLKRKVAELPPVNASVFEEKVLAQRAAEALERDSKQSRHCGVCHKTFSNLKSLQSHERSRKHQEMVDKVAKTALIDTENKSMKQELHQSKKKTEVLTETSEQEEEETEGESEPLESNECLFCPNYEDDMEANLVHMSKAHGFFIPDLEYLVDLVGLISYLGEKVGVGNLCLYCNERGKQFFSVEAAQHHMTEKGHCKLHFDGDTALEYAEFYDYTKSYPDKDESGLVLEDEQLVHDQSLSVNKDLELVLPSGTVVGHRYLKNYYKQRVPTQERRKATTVSRVMAQYRSLGWRGLCDDNGKKERDEDWSQKMRQQQLMSISVRANKMQKHFRPQVVF